MLTEEQKASLLFKKHIGVADTKTERDFYEETVKSSFVVSPGQLLMYGDRIPCSDNDINIINEIRSLKDGEIYYWQKDEATRIPIVQYHENVQTVKIDNGTDTAFKVVDENGNMYRNIIPFNYYKDVYNYSIQTKNGKKIYFGVGDWQLDIYSGILRFYSKDSIPKGVDHNNPPLISFYQYVGGTGFRQDNLGYDGVIMPINNYHISKGTYIVDPTTEENGLEVTLEEAISRQSNKVLNNFVATFGFDGSNTNEGIAYSLEKIINLQYTSTKDIVKGYDQSKNSNIGVLLTRMSSIGANLNITFTSQNVKLGEHTIYKNQNVVSFDDGTWKSISKITQLYNSEGEFITVEDLENLGDGEFKFTTTETTTSAILLYWSAEDRSYVPFINKEDNYYDFGFPLVTANGRLPPDVKIGATSLGFYNDAITPEYYGPRTFTVTIAVETGTNIKSADYVVRNRLGYYLDDILSQIENDYPKFIGTIFLRAGTYEVNTTGLDLSNFKNLILLGEDKEKTIIKGDISFINSNADFKGLITLKELTFLNLSLKTVNENFIIKSCVLNDADITKEYNNLIIKESSVSKLLIKGPIDEENEFVTYNHIYSNNLGEVDIQTGHTFYYGNVINTLSLSDVPFDNIKSCVIQYCINKPSQTNLLDCTTLKFTSPSKIASIPQQSHFPIFSKNSDQCIEYAMFSYPFEIKWSDETSNKITLKIDSEYLYIKDNGELSCHLDADHIMVFADRLERNPSYEGNEPTYNSDDEGRKSLQAVLEDVFLTKADLNPNGKIPLDELPDSVAYGGLLYVGTWSFEYMGSNGKYVDGGDYPEYKDALKNITLDQEQNEQLQPGWFWIVESSKKDPDKPAAEQKAVHQKITNQETGEVIYEELDSHNKETCTIYTAGDWVIWNGTYFEKLDRAYNDVAYMVLPTYTPGVDGEGHFNWSWNWKSNEDYDYGYGALDLNGVTIAEAFDQVNQELLKLRAKHPATCKEISLVPFYEDYKEVYFYPIENGSASLTIQKGYDSNKDERVLNFRVKTPQIEPKYKSGIYVTSFSETDKATIQFVMDGNSHQITVNSLDTTDNYDETKNCHVSAPFDPYKDKFIGKGYWKSIYADFGTSDNTLSIGSHLYKMGIISITPYNHMTKDAICTTDDFRFTIVKPYDFSKNEGNTDNSIVNSEQNINTTDISNLEANDVCSGVYKIGHEITLKFSFIVRNCINEINATRQIITLTDLLHNIDYAIPEENITFINSPEDEYYGIRVDNFNAVYPISCVIEDLQFRVNIYDVYNNIRTYNLNYNFKLRVDPTSEIERVYSGGGLYPTFDTTSNVTCGYPFNSSKLLSQGSYKKELQKVGRNYQGQIISEYKWPSGQYESYSAKVDYLGLSTIGETIDDKTYRFATFSMFNVNGEYKEIILDESSGFFLHINVNEDKLKDWTYDEYSASTDNIILQVKVVNDSLEDQSVTSWINANSPYDGFSIVGTENGQPCMYAGTSTITSKRITFGTNTYSGKLIVRIGILANSNLTFKDISIDNII